MPAPLPAPHCAQSVWHMDMGTSHFSWRTQWHYDGAWDPTDVHAVNAALIAAIDAHLMGAMDSNVTCVDVESIDLADVAHAAVVDVDGTSGGVSTSAPLPLNVTLSILHHVASRVRGGKPHMFLTGFSQSKLTAGAPTQWTAGTVAQADSFDSFVDAALSATHPTLGALQRGVVHYHRHKVALDPPEFEAFTGPGSADARPHGRTRRLGRV